MYLKDMKGKIKRGMIFISEVEAFIALGGDIDENQAPVLIDDEDCFRNPAWDSITAQEAKLVSNDYEKQKAIKKLGSIYYRITGE